MTQSFFETESTHTNVMYWWHGVIVDDKYWAGCDCDDVSNEEFCIHNAKQLEESPKKGWGKRYKVAIVGRHYAIKGSASEADLLEMAEVIYPVTAGSGLGGTNQSAALRQGTHVVGFYADGKEGRHPVILGAFGVNEQNEPYIFKGDPKEFFKLRSDNAGQCNQDKKPVSTKDENPDNTPVESTDGRPHQLTKSKIDKRLDGGKIANVYPTYGCESPQGIIDQIKTLLNELSYYTTAITQGSANLAADWAGVVKSITSEITGLANGLIDRMRGYLVNKINNGVKDVMNKLPPFLRPDFNLNVQDALDGLSCNFNNIKNAILNIVKDLVNQFINNYVTAPVCAATSFLGSLLGNVIGQVNGAVDSAVGAINNILDIGSQFANFALDVVEIALDLLKLFACDKDNPECPTIKRWSFWYGPEERPFAPPPGLTRTIGNIISEVETVLPGSASGAAANPCNSRQIPCGPPSIQFSGGGGFGAAANPVISGSGRILGLDFSSFGSGYTSSPVVNAIDSCGTGNGAVIQPIMEPTGTFNEFQEEILEMTGAVVIDSGTQYLPAPNGTTGGNGLIVSKPSDTIRFKENKNNYDVYKCGTTFQVNVGDEVYLPSSTLAYVYNENGEIVQTLNGLGSFTKIVIEAAGTLTAPCNPDNVPTLPPIEFPLSAAETPLPPITRTLPSGEEIVVPPAEQTIETILEQVPTTVPLTNKPTYPVVLEIERIFIKNPGVNYSPEDKIIIENNKGAELEFKVNEIGEVVEVVVVNGGIGFTDVPFIYIESEQGYNFDAVPIFNFRPLSEIDLNNITPTPGAKLISVVDCVGKIQPKKEFDRVPNS